MTSMKILAACNQLKQSASSQKMVERIWTTKLDYMPELQNE